MKKKMCNEESYVFRIVYSKPNATFRRGGTAEVAVSFSINRPKRRNFNLFVLNSGDMRGIVWLLCMCLLAYLTVVH